jgi:hypothetical protein
MEVGVNNASPSSQRVSGGAGSVASVVVESTSWVPEETSLDVTSPLTDVVSSTVRDVSPVLKAASVTASFVVVERSQLLHPASLADEPTTGKVDSFVPGLRSLESSRVASPGETDASSRSLTIIPGSPCFCEHPPKHVRQILRTAKKLTIRAVTIMGLA